jgi:hypothetical protein
MKKILLLFHFALGVMNSHAQSETFDITTFTAPKAWKKEKSESAIQFSKEDAAKGTYCMITLLKAVPGTSNAKENFDAAWETVVKSMVKVEAAPTMQPGASENGWEAQSGYSPFELEGNKGIALLVTSSGFDKMVNIVILTNTDIYEKEMTAFLESISFKKVVVNTVQNKPVIAPLKNNNAATPAKKDGFAFTTTNFDDGWNSTVQEDWVEVTKENIKVLLHYPKAGTIFPADPEPLTTAAWNILVAPRYKNLKNYKTAYISTYNRPYLGMGYATENATGKNVFIVFFRQDQTWIEFITPDKNTFIRQYKFDPETIRWDSESDLMIPLANMASYNKFAIAASDFKGKWTSDFTGIQQMYNVYTGNYAGMNMNQSNEEFVFASGNTYNWKLLVVNGMVGNMKFADVKSSGKFNVPNNWQIHFTKIETRARTYNAFWSCIKGARILNLLDADFPGSGIYTKYGLAK